MGHKRRAFTLIEILTITVIIALIVAAVLMPTLGAMRRRAKTVMCANNLKRLSQAVGTRRSDELQRRVSQLSPSRWQTDLARYLPLDSNDLVCPEYDPDDDVPPVGQQYRFHIYTHAYPQTEYYYSLDDSPSVAKMSDTQYRQAKADGYLKHGARLSDYTEYQGYEADDQSNVAWYAVEESTPQHQWQGDGTAASADHEDARMRVTDNGDGTLDLYFERGSTVVFIALVPAAGGDAIRIFHPGNTSPDPVTVPGGSADLASYGVNVYTRSIQGGAKILAVDYIWTTASPRHTWANMRRGERPDIPAFARHRGLMNAAFMDGSVRLMQPADIDPANLKAATAYWLP